MFIRSVGAALVLCSVFSAKAAPVAETVPLGRLPRTVLPTHVAVELKIDPGQPRFSGRVRLDLKLAAATRVLWLHGRDLHITQATVTPPGGSAQTLAVTLADVSGVLRLEAPQPIAAGRARVDIAYDAAFGALQGAYHVRAGGDDYVMTQMEPLGARNAFPGFDEPGFKQPWDISLVIPQAQNGVANTRLVRTLPAEAGWKKLVFATTEALPSYLIAFAVGPWDIVDGPTLPANAVRSKPLALRGVAPRGQGPRMRYALAHTGEIVAAEEAYFGIPYPFDKLDILAAPDFWAGAMENAGLITYRDRLLYADEQSDVGQRQGYWETHAHELAHQWFGDLVTMPWWDDLWLNEAFATWMSAKIMGELQPGFHADRGLMEGAIYAMGQDSLASTRRIHEPIKAYTDVQSAFDGITYQKGGAVLAMFERYVGPDRFRDGIRRYLRAHARGNATSADLVGAVAEASTDPAGVRAAFNSFLDQPGVPIVGVTVDCAGATPVLKIEQRRFLPVGSTAPGDGSWQIPMCVRWGDDGGTHGQCGLVGGPSATLPLQAQSCPAWVMPNASGAGYYRFALSPPDTLKLEAHFEQLDEREQRAYADSVAAAYSAGALDTRGFLRAAQKLAQSPVRQAVTAPIGRLDWLLRHGVDTPADRQALRDFIVRIYGPRLSALGTAPRADESDEDRLLRRSLLEAVAELGREPALRAQLAAQGRRLLGVQGADAATPGDGQLHLETVGPDQRALALRVAMEEGDAAVFDALLARAAASQDSVLRGDLFSAAAAARQPALQARARALALQPGAVHRNEILLLVTGGRRGRPLGSDDDPAAMQAQRDWIEASFDTIVPLIAPGGGALVSIYADNLCSSAEADLLQAKFAARVRDIESAPRALAQGVEAARLCAALKSKQQDALLRLP